MAKGKHIKKYKTQKKHEKSKKKVCVCVGGINEHFAAGGSTLTDAPTMARKGDLSWKNLIVLRTTMGCWRT